MAKNHFLPDALIDEVARRFRALGEPVRLRILRVLQAGEHSVNEVAAELGAGQSNVSRHLQALHDCHLVDRRREANTTLYFISDPFVGQLCDLVCQNAMTTAQTKLRSLAKPKA